MKSLYQQLQNWYNSHLGHQLLEAEHKGLNSFIEQIFGYYVLQLGGPRQIDLLNKSPIGHKFYFDTEGHFPNMIHGKFTELPFLPDSIDLIITPHILEFSVDPKKILSEIYHILIPEGRVIIIGFNPFSLWGLTHLFKSDNKIPWAGKFISISRLKHWLSKIGFTVLEYTTFFFRPAILDSEKLHKTLFMEGIGQVLWPYCGAIYILVAKKSVITLTPIKEKRRLIREHVPVTSTYAKPTTRIKHEES
jgi:SAM-dependent methyltransferase